MIWASNLCLLECGPNIVEGRKCGKCIDRSPALICLYYLCYSCVHDNEIRSPLKWIRGMKPIISSKLLDRSPAQIYPYYLHYACVHDNEFRSPLKWKRGIKPIISMQTFGQKPSPDMSILSMLFLCP